MEFLLALLFAWAVITLVGHVSWLVAQSLWRIVTGSTDLAGREGADKRSSTTDGQQRPNPVSDMMAFERMIDALHSTHAISPKMARELKRRARVFAGLERVPTKELPPPKLTQAVPNRSEDRAAGDPPLAFDERVENDEPAHEPTGEPAAVGRHVAVDTRPVRPVPGPPPATPQRALSEVIASFLAAHNIRWGELIAGLLIVVCSIGLVVSLWNTLTSTHRVVPSLIFMSGDAAIFAAGLYTMRRWKLRHTSRAVLIIATLLVPLCVLAGLAAAGANVDSVSLLSPWTLATIIVGTLGCGWLLWQASHALVGRGSAVLLTASVVAPALCLPLLPTAARVLGLYASSFLFVPAVVSAIALLIPARRFGRVRVGNEDQVIRIGRRFWKNHWLRIGIAASSLASVVVYAAFLYRADGRLAWIQIAIATIPFWIAVAVLHASYLGRIWGEKKWALERFIGSVLVVIAIGCVLAILPASIERLSWLRMHAFAVSISLILATWLLESKWRVIAAGLPLGLAAMLSSPDWLAGMQWSEVPLRRMLLSGEPLIVALGLTIVNSVLWWVRSTKSQRSLHSIDLMRIQPSDLVPAFWAVVAGGQAIVLSVAPTSWLGILPVAALAGILATLTVMLATTAMRFQRTVWFSAVTGCSFWIASLGLVRWDEEGVNIVDHAIAPAMLGLSFTMLLLAVVFKIVWNNRTPTSWTSAGPSISRLTEFSAAAACGVLGTLAILAVIGQTSGWTAPTWRASTWLIAAASILLTAASVVVNRRAFMRCGMFASAMAVFCGVTYFAGIELWRERAWIDSSAIWSLSGILVVVAAGWFGVREAVRWKQPQLLPLFATRFVMPDGWIALTAVGLISIGVAWQYLAVLSGPLGIQFESWFGMSLGSFRITGLWYTVLAGAASCVGLWCVREPNLWMPRVLRMLGAFGGLLLAILISCRLTESPALRLVATTTLASAGILAAWLVRSWKTEVRENSVGPLRLDRLVGISTIALLVSLGSAVLLGSNWWLPISHGISPDRWSTLAVASWWIIASLGLLFGRASQQEQVSDVGSAATGRHVVTRVLSAMLLPMAVLIITPILFSVLPVVWWQASSLGSVVWLLLAWAQNASSRLSVQLNRPAAERLSPFTNLSGWASERDPGDSLSSLWISVVGMTSAAVSLWFVLHWQHSIATVAWTLPLGIVTSLLALLVACRDSMWAAKRHALDGPRILNSLPFLPVLMSGHVAMIAETMGWVAAPNTRLIVMGCGLVGCIGSAMLVWRKSPPLHVWHVVAQAVALACFAIFDGWRIFHVTSRFTGWPEWIALAGLATGAISLLRFVPADEPEKNAISHLFVEKLPRLFGWFIAIAGVWILHTHPGISWRPDLIENTFLVGWAGVCVVLWRSDRSTVRGNQQPTRADVGVSWLLLPLLTLSLLDLVSWVGSSRGPSVMPTAMCCVQAVIAVAVACSAWLRTAVVPSRQLSMWTNSMTLFTGASAMAAAGASRLFADSWEVPIVVAITAAAVSTTIIVAALPWAERLRARRAGGMGAELATNSSVDRLNLAIERVILCLAWLGAFVAFGLYVSGSETNLIRVSALAIGALAWSLFQLSEQTSPVSSEAAERRRWYCVTVGLLMIALIAVLGEQGGQAWVLVAAMRLLVAGVLVIGVLMIAVPRLLRGPFVERWQFAFRRGGRLAAWVTGAALLSMLGLEVVLRESGVGIPGIGKPLIVVVAAMLGALAMMCGAIAILSGPGFSNISTNRGTRANWLRMDDSLRRRLLYAAQLIAAMAWLHVFLCRTGMAFLGLRQVWPYVVMLLAFASVGLTQWAVRRGDQVLSDAMRKNAMFLPLIPVIGFWLSGTYAAVLESQPWSWTFYRGTTSYQGLLIVGAIYYGVLSVMWKRGLPRIATVVLANAALWVMLTQTPGWDFLTHPQAWLIPPAACVLAVAYWQRDQLDSNVGSAIRYGATLAIYISSTADMLMSEIGSSLWGPIVLILLSLVGMLVGVALRIKPFLYLGTIFVFLGVTSMVWHAGQALDAVWPWWVFGITTGLILLSILAGIEKHRDKLQRWSDELAKWES